MCAPATDAAFWSALFGIAGVLAAIAAVVMMRIDRKRAAGRITRTMYAGVPAADYYDQLEMRLRAGGAA